MRRISHTRQRKAIFFGLNYNCYIFTIFASFNLFLVILEQRGGRKDGTVKPTVGKKNVVSIELF